MMRVFVEGLCIDAEIGALWEERGRVQPLVIDIVAETSVPTADDMDQACDYRLLAQVAREVLADGHIVLIETAASRIADACLARTTATRVSVTMRKPAALHPAMAGVTSTRTREEAA